MIMIRELNEYFERFEREKEIRNLQPEDTYVCKIPVRLFELIKNSLRPGQPELDVIASKLDEKYDNAPEIPGFSHNEQKNREELDKLADQLKTTCAELKYIQTKDVKKHVVEYLAKKKRKRKTNLRKDKKQGGEPKRPCYNSREVQPKSESLKSCQNKAAPRGRYGAQRTAQPMLTMEESQAHNHQGSLLLMTPRHAPQNIPMPDSGGFRQSTYTSQVPGTNTDMNLEAENLNCGGVISFLDQAFQQNDNGENGGLPPSMMPSLMKQSPTPSTIQDFQQQMQMFDAMASPPQQQQANEKPLMNTKYGSNQTDDYNINQKYGQAEADFNGVDYMSLMQGGGSTFGATGTEATQVFDHEMPMVGTSSMSPNCFQMLAGGRMWNMSGPC